MADRGPELRSVHRALADPLRLRLLDGLQVRAQSAKELGARLGIAADRLYYHLRQLERAGLVEVREYRELPGGKVERVYAPAPVEPADEGAGPAETAHFLGQALLATRADVNQAFAAKEQGADRQVYLTRCVVRLSRARLERLHAQMEELLREAREDPDEDEDVWTGALFALVDLQDRAAGAGGR